MIRKISWKSKQKWKFIAASNIEQKDKENEWNWRKSWDKYSHAHKYQHELMAYPFYHSMLIEIHNFLFFRCCMMLLLIHFPGISFFFFLVFIFCCCCWTAIFFLCVWKYPFVQDIFFSRFADFLLFFLYFTSHHRREKQKNEKNMSKLTEKEEQIKSNTAKNGKENFPSYFSLFCPIFLFCEFFSTFFLCEIQQNLAIYGNLKF